MERATYDYIIVGGGSAGCVLANRLSADPSISVCLLEAGPPDRNPLIHVPLGILWMMRSRTLNWGYQTAPQVHLANRSLFWPRGRTLGGSSSSNAMCYTRGHRWDYDHWRDLGNPGWGYADVLPYFRRSQNQERGASEYHGAGGPLNVADLRSPNLLSRVFVKAAGQAGYPTTTDFNGAEQEGVGLYQVTQKDGHRCSAARAYLRPAEPRANLAVLTGAHATRLLFEGRRAIGVECLKSGQTMRVYARREAILSGGAINSPQLLLLSGVGPDDELQRHGIPVVHRLPGVGKNLQDHLDAIVVQQCIEPVSFGFTPVTLMKAVKEFVVYVSAKKGMFTTNGAEAGGFVRSDPGREIPDLQFHFTPIRLRDHGRDLRFMFGHGYSLHVCHLRPRSRGHIGLASADPAAASVIQPNYLSDPADLEALVRGVRIARAVLAQPAFDPYRGAEIVPGEGVRSDDEIRAFIRRHAETIYHPAGTCKMGSDAMAVVDARLRVHGLKGVRVVDASIMPTLLGGNTNAPVIMIAEKAADMILEDAKAGL